MLSISGRIHYHVILRGMTSQSHDIEYLLNIDFPSRKYVIFIGLIAYLICSFPICLLLQSTIIYYFLFLNSPSHYYSYVWLSLPKYESSHEFQTKKKRQQQRQNEENAKRLKMQHPQQHTRLPPIQQAGQQHPQMRQGPNHPIHGSQPAVAAGPSHHYGKPRGPSGGPGRYPSGGNSGGGYNHPNRAGQGGGSGYGSGPYPPQGRGAPYGSSGMPGGPSGGPRGGGGSGYGVGAPNYPQGAPYGGSAAGRGSNMMGGNRNQQYGWQQ